MVETQVFILNRNGIRHRADGGEVAVLTKSENTQILTKALAYGWKYRKHYENGMSVKGIMEEEKRGERCVYKYINLAYIPPRIVNDIMDGEVSSQVNLQMLFGIASAYEDFEQQEAAFYAR